MFKKQQTANPVTPVDAPHTEEDAKANAIEAPSPVLRDRKSTSSHRSQQQQSHMQRARMAVVDRAHYLN